MPTHVNKRLTGKKRTRPSLRLIKNRLKRALPDLQRKYGVKYLGLFGSFIRHKENRRSDLDILVDFNRDISLIQFVSLEIELCDLLGIKVDLVDRETLKPEIGSCPACR